MLRIIPVGLWIGFISILAVVISCVSGAGDDVYAADNETRTIAGLVQSQDLRRVDQAIVQARDQEGNVVAQGVTNQAGEFSVIVPQEGTYSVSAIPETYRSEYVVVKVGTDKPAPFNPDIALTGDNASKNL